MRVIFLGFGDLARRSAPLFGDSGWHVTGLRRSAVTFPGIEVIAGDCRDPRCLADVLPGRDLVVVTLTPDDYSEAGYRRAYLESARTLNESLDHLARNDGESAPKLVLWISDP